MPAPIYWTQEPVDTANTNRDGSGTLVLLARLDAREFIYEVVCEPLGTNAATIGFLLGSNGQGLANSRNVVVLGRQTLAATTAGTVAATDSVVFPIAGWLPEGFEIWAGVHDAQAAGRQFFALSSPTYERASYEVTNITG